MKDLQELEKWRRWTVLLLSAAVNFLVGLVVGPLTDYHHTTVMIIGLPAWLIGLTITLCLLAYDVIIMGVLLLPAERTKNGAKVQNGGAIRTCI